MRGQHGEAGWPSKHPAHLAQPIFIYPRRAQARASHPLCLQLEACRRQGQEGQGPATKAGQDRMGQGRQEQPDNQISPSKHTHFYALGFVYQFLLFLFLLMVEGYNAAPLGQHNKGHANPVTPLTVPNSTIPKCWHATSQQLCQLPKHRSTLCQSKPRKPNPQDSSPRGLRRKGQGN